MEGLFAVRKSENSAVSEVTKHPSVKDSVNFQEPETYTFSICGLKAVPDPAAPLVQLERITF